MSLMLQLKKKLLLKLIMELNIEMYIKGMLNKTIKMQLFLCHFIKKNYP